MTDYPDYQTPAEHARQISVTGVPLLTGAAGILQQSFNPAAGVTQSSATLAVTQIGFEAIVQSSFSVAPTTPFVRVQLEWFSSGYAVRVATDTYICVASTTPGAFTTYITGKTKGDQVVVHVTNLDGLQVNLTTVSVLENSRVYTSDQVRWDNRLNAGLAVAGFTLPSLPADESVLGVLDGVTIAASSQNGYLFAPHSGLVDIGWEVGTGAAANLGIRVRPKPDTEYSGHNILYSAVNPPLNFQIAAPHAPLGIIVVNSATTAMAMSLSAVRAD